MSIIGIDLGTTNSLVSVLTEQGPVVLDNAHGEPMFPSAVASDGRGNTLIGQAAVEGLSWSPEAGVRWFKRDMGLATQRELGGQMLGPVELSSLILAEARSIAERALGTEVTQAVITVPAYFKEPARSATVEAGRLAGLEVVRVVNEPTAAALAHGLDNAEEERRCLVLDLGGGTLDVSILEIFDGIIEVTATAGDARLGGEDFTDALHLLAREESGVRANTPLDAMLRAACEAAKRELTLSEEVLLELPTPGLPMWRRAGELRLSRPLFQSITQPLWDRIRACLSGAMTSSAIEPSGIDEVLLVGGATRMNGVSELVRQVFGREPSAGPHPDQAVALGAAIQAGLVARHEAVEDLVVTDVLSHSLGVEVVRSGKDRMLEGYYLPVLHRNTTLPTRRIERVFTVHPEQTELRIQVFQGEHRYTRHNQPLGEFSVTGLPPGKDGGTQAVDLSFAQDLSGLLEVEATVVSTGKKAHMLIERRSGRLTESERQRALRVLERLKLPPRELLPNRLLLEKALALSSRLDATGKAMLEAPLLAFEDALEREDLPEIEAAAQVLRRWVED